MVPLQLILFSIPSIIYAVVQRRRGMEWRDIFERLGLQGSRPVYFLWTLGVTLVTGALGWVAFSRIPPEIFSDPNISHSEYAGWTLSLASFFLVFFREAIFVALGEEIFFRGFLGGWLFRRFGFPIGNAIQTLVFLLPHLLLLTVSLDLWLIVVVQLVAGWFLGWLRFRSASILPGWLAHSLINALGALPMMN
jgi:uncharacterized protein